MQIQKCKLENVNLKTKNAKCKLKNEKCKLKIGNLPLQRDEALYHFSVLKHFNTLSLQRDKVFISYFTALSHQCNKVFIFSYHTDIITLVYNISYIIIEYKDIFYNNIEYKV